MSAPDMDKYYGIYRGNVINNIDPMQVGRIMVEVPDVAGLFPAIWAMPCAPFAGTNMGAFMVPQIGASVWIQFEKGDPDYPVWLGGFWGTAGEVPRSTSAGVQSDPNIILQSAFQNALVISDAPGPDGGIMLKSASGATITVNDTGIYIQNGKGASIVMVGPTVTVNNGALEIT